eukprot:scaffold6231_cov108-Cylindrotheca_fusiformis.AAC.3
MCVSILVARRSNCGGQHVTKDRIWGIHGAWKDANKGVVGEEESWKQSILYTIIRDMQMGIARCSGFDMQKYVLVIIREKGETYLVLVPRRYIHV